MIAAKITWRVAVIAAISVAAVLLAFVFFNDGGDSHASERRSVREVALANRKLAAAGFPSRFCEHQSASSRGTAPYVVVLSNGVSKAAAIRAVADCGARVIGPLPPNALLVETSVFAMAKMSQNACFAAAAEWLPEDKLDSNLKSMVDSGAPSLDVTLVALAPSDVDSLVGLVAAKGGERMQGCLNGKSSVTLKLPVGLVGKLVRRGDVRWMEPFVRPKPLNDLAVEPSMMNARAVWNAHGLTGGGQLVTTSDTGIDTGNLSTMHADLRNRVAGFRVSGSCYDRDENGHGTHTAGSIVGDGTLSDGQIRGVAYGARLWAWFCGGKGGYIYTPDSCEELFRPTGATNACIHSASWGCDDKGNYDAQSVAIDEYVWENPDFLPVIANGNAGSASQTVGSPATAKNVLSVGATQSSRTGHDGGYGNGDPTKIASFSSRGPCADGRIKPDVCSPGVGIASTRAYACSYAYGIHSNTNYAYDSGTSMATPLTAGAAALVRQWLVERRGFTNAPPSAALVKAVLTGGAKGVTVPNGNFGWGRVDLGESLYPSNRAVRLADRIPFGTNGKWTLPVTLTNDAPLDVQLVWIDYPGTSGTGHTLVNDLDLIVSNRTSGAVWYGNGITGGDRTNTVESVRIEEAASGDYTVTVRSHDIYYDSASGGAAAVYMRGSFDGGEESTYDFLRIVSADPYESEVSVKVGETNVFSVVVEASTNLVLSCEWQLDGVIQSSATTNFTYAAELSDHGSHLLVFSASAEGIESVSRSWTVSVSGELRVDAATGDDATATGSADRPFATISAALSKAVAGDTLRVGAGAYAGGLAVPAGVAQIVAEAGPGCTVIDGGGTNRCFDASSSPSTVLAGFTLINGASTNNYGGGLLYGVVSNCIIRSCTAAKGGGGACYAVLTDCVIADCTAEGQGGGAYASTLVNCTVRGNRAKSRRGRDSQSAGGGVDFQCTCTNSIAWGNVGPAGGVDDWEWHRKRRWGWYDYAPYFYWSCTESSVPFGSNSFTNDPLFASSDDADARVYEISPCIGSGCGGENVGAYRGTGVVKALPEIDVKTATGEEISNAVASVGYVDKSVAAGIGTNGATYAEFRAWSTNGLKSTAVVFSTRAYDSFLVRDLVAEPTLLGEGNDTKAEVTALEPSADGTCSTTLRLVDGTTALPLCTVKAAFAKRSNVGDEVNRLSPADASQIAVESADEGRAVKLTIQLPLPTTRYFFRFDVK